MLPAYVVAGLPTEPPHWPRSFFSLGSALLCAALVLFGGCGYSVRPMHPEHVRTVHVPMVASNDWRRNLEFRLTESIVKQIEEQTPYKVVDRENADTILQTRILGLTKHALAETPTDELRNIQINLVAETSWQDLRNGQMLTSPQQIDLPSAFQRVPNTAEFVPEIGESFATASQEAIDDLAEQIVAMMEEPW